MSAGRARINEGAGRAEINESVTASGKARRPLMLFDYISFAHCHAAALA